MNTIVCDKKICTGCNACVNICSRNAIHPTDDEYGNITMNIDETQCVSCGLCNKVCPSKNDIQLNSPMKAYAAWNKNNEIRSNSASGGIAASIYRLSLHKEYLFCGVEINDKMIAEFKIGNNIEDILKFSNSKYTFSFIKDVYKQIFNLLNDNQNLVFIGLPCQVAGLISYLKHRPLTLGKLVTVDLVCHGTPPSRYLQEHADWLTQKYKKNIDKCFFRDPMFGTSNHYMSFYGDNETKPFYKKNAHSDDTYQIGYHKAYIYKENCYTCKYAQNKRTGDITISDYRWEEINGNRKEISNVLVNTNAGVEFYNELCEYGEIESKEYPLEIALKLDKQLNHPSVKTKNRDIFLRYYYKYNNYDKAAKKAFKKEIIKRRIYNFSHFDRFKQKLRNVVPKRIKKILKKCRAK